MSNCERKVGAFESEFEYNPDCGLPTPELWLPAGWRPNKSNKTAFGRGPRKRRGTWFGTTARRLVVTDRGRAWTFAGGNEGALCNYISVPRPSISNSEAFSAIALVRFDGLADYQGIVSTLHADPYPNWVLYAQSDGSWGTHVSDHRRTAAAAVTTGVWYVLAVTYDGDALTLFQDGVQVKQDLGVSYTADNSPACWAIGRFYADGDLESGAAHHNGQIASASVFRDALLPSQIRLSCKSFLDGSPPMARPIGRVSFPAASAGVTLVVQDSQCIVESESLGLTQHQVLVVASAESVVESDTVALVQHHILTVGGSESLVTSEQPALTQHQVLTVGGSECVVTSESPSLTQHQVLAVADSECLVESEAPGLTQHQVLAIQDSESLVESSAVALTQHQLLAVDGSESVVESESPALVQHQVLTVAGAESVIESENVTLTAHEAEFAVRNSQVSVTSESPSLTQHQVLVVADAEITVVSESPTFIPHLLLVLGDCVSLVVSESPVLTLHLAAPSVIRRGPSAEDTQLRRAAGEIGRSLRRGPSDTDKPLRRPDAAP